MTMYRLNDFMRIRLGSPVIFDLLLERRSVKVPDVRVLSLLGRVRQRMSEPDLIKLSADVFGCDAAAAESLVTKLIAAGVLQDADHEHELMPEVHEWKRYGWLDALVLHCLSEGQNYCDVVDAADPHSPDDVLQERIARHGLPAFWKQIDTDRVIVLSEPREYPPRDLGEVLLARRTHIPWSGEVMDAKQVSRVLLDANKPLVAMRRRAEEEYVARPSALLENAYADMETYFVSFDVDGIPPGLYHYDPAGHRLSLVRAGDLREEVRTAFTGQERASSGSCALLLSAVWERHMLRYEGDPRAYRTLLTLVGQFAQRYLVALTAFGFTTFPTPAHQPVLADDLIGTNRFEESSLYLIAAG
ncbi:SagB/ThcOx family dehydrogenase [Streptomyces rishiriensis]|uniref:SagB/ThcOx family dehydrogenase n=1 Tax=Streptomyces rishiriensis TaxID=68264 RepID=UPI00131F47E3|nr:SagB/ThcOx family dehydrogenase [Streptomyces rishiriensis]